jgi:histidyl-tRNA synthetase
MSKIKPRLFKGSRDFLPEQMLHRERIVDSMKKIFRKYGFAPLETPAIEYLDVLSGKYGDEADKLIYKLNYKTGTVDEAALHYDLTVPLSRVVAMNADLPLPFKRYQVQPVWRADRPQPHQGRFREFYQCDCDVIGSNSPIVDAELLAITCEVLQTLGFKDFVVKINNRKILNGITQYVGLPSTATQNICRCIDKLDKVPWSDVEEELQQYNYATSTMHKLKDLFHDNDISLSQLRSLLSEIPEALDGISELESIFGYLKIWGIDDSNYVFDIALARGLDYYTGPIFETKLPKHPHIGSLTGGGRYDTMIGMFTGKDLPAVGTTLGLDRIFTAMQQLDMLENVSTHTKVLIANFSASTLEYNLKLLSILRNNNIAAEIFPESSKLKKQFMYAERKGIRFMIIAGDDEVVNSMYNLKNLSTGEQSSLALEELIRILQ